MDTSMDPFEVDDTEMYVTKDTSTKIWWLAGLNVFCFQERSLKVTFETQQQIEEE